MMRTRTWRRNRKHKRACKCSNCGRQRKGVLPCRWCGHKLSTKRNPGPGGWRYQVGGRFVTRQDYDLARGKSPRQKKPQLAKPHSKLTKVSSKIVIPKVTRSMISNLDAYASINNFRKVFTGPGVYFLIDGRATDGNIVYFGMSVVSIVMRVSQHLKTKTFDKVGVILPRTCNDNFVRNLEASVMAEFVDTYGELPYYNKRQESFVEGTRVRPWRSAARRKKDLAFI